MTLNGLRFLGTYSVALLNLPSGAHLLEMPNKLRLASVDYLVAQQIYQGWAWIGILVAASLAVTLALAVALRRQRRAFGFAMIAVLCILGAQAVFWFFVHPVNLETAQWTVLDGHWMQHRLQWEYSHAAGAVLHLLALASVVLAALDRED